MIAYLCQTDPPALITIFQILFAAMVPLLLWRLTTWQRQYEGLEQRLYDATTKLISERITAVSNHANNHHRSASVSIDDLRLRMQAVDAAVAAMSDRDLKIELTLASKLDLLKDYIREFAICKPDLERYEQSVDRRLTRIEGQLQEMSV